MLKRLLKVIVLFLIVSIPSVGTTYASLLDTETSIGNTFSAASLDFSLRDTTDAILTSPLFNISSIKPGDSDTKSVRVKNDGILDFGHKIWQEKTSGDDILCDALQIEAKLDDVTQYNGNLTGLN